MLYTIFDGTWCFVLHYCFLNGHTDILLSFYSASYMLILRARDKSTKLLILRAMFICRDYFNWVGNAKYRLWRKYFQWKDDVRIYYFFFYDFRIYSTEISGFSILRKESNALLVLMHWSHKVKKIVQYSQLWKINYHLILGLLILTSLKFLLWSRSSPLKFIFVKTNVTSTHYDFNVYIGEI